MRRYQNFCLMFLFFIFILSGCVVRTYTVTKDRVDQDMAVGNRGYLQGKAPADSQSLEKKTTRTIKVVEVELHSPIKFDKSIKQDPNGENQESRERQVSESSGNRGYITRDQEQEAPTVSVASGNQENPVEGEKYTIGPDDTLQKISQKFFGTSKKWLKIYNANKDVLKGPNKIYPGQVITIPIEANSVKQGEENLK